MDLKTKITAKDCIHLANDIIVDRNLLIPRLTSLKDINYELFVLIFDDIFGFDSAQQLSSFEPKSKAQEIRFMAKLLDHLSEDLFSISLDHIRAEDIVDRKLNPIYNLLEIISTFVKYIPKTFNKNVSLDLKFNTKAVQTNGSENEMIGKQLKSDHLLQKFNERRFAKQLKSDSTSSSQSIQTTSSESNESMAPLRQMNSCGDYWDKSNRKQESVKQSKAIQTQTETQITPKSIVLSKSVVSPKDYSFDDYKQLKCENFATLLGHRLHETLKLKELTDCIEYKIKKYYGDVTTQTPKAKSTRRQSFRSKKSPLIRRNNSSLKSKTNLKQSFGTKTTSLDNLIKLYPEIPRNTIKSLKEQEKHQKKVIENLNKDILVNELKVKSKLNEAIETQQKRSQLIRNEIKQLESLAETQGSKMSIIKENASKRDSRIERARMKKLFENYKMDLNSKYKRLQSIEEKIVVKEFDKRQKQQKDYINEFRKRIKETHSSEMDKQKKMLNAFETLYQNKYEMLSQNLIEEEKRLKNQISDQTYYLRSMKRELNSVFERDLKTMFKS